MTADEVADRVIARHDAEPYITTHNAVRKELAGCVVLDPEQVADLRVACDRLSDVSPRLADRLRALLPPEEPTECGRQAWVRMDDRDGQRLGRCTLRPHGPDVDCVLRVPR